VLYSQQVDRDNLQRGEGDAEMRARTQRWEDEERRRLEAKEERLVLRRDQEKYEREKQNKSSAVSSRYVDDFMPAHLRQQPGPSFVPHSGAAQVPRPPRSVASSTYSAVQHLVDDEAMEDDDIDDEDV
jgi:predicted phage gp36 major capsid-like protein